MPSSDLYSSHPGGDVGLALKQVGLPVSVALAAFSENPENGARQLLGLRDSFPRLGGASNHQDILDFAIVRGLRRVPRLGLAMSNERLARRPQSPQTWIQHSSLLGALGDDQGCAAARLRGRDLGFEQGGTFS